MAIIFSTKKAQSSLENILVTNNDNIGEIINVDSNHFILKFIFGLSLTSLNNNPRYYKKVKITLLTQSEQQKQNNLIEDLLKNNDTFDPTSKYNESKLIKDNLSKNKDKSESITSKYVYIDDKVNLALNNKVNFIDLNEYKPLINPNIESNRFSIFDSIISTKRGIDKIIFQTSTNNSQEDKNLLDYLIYSNFLTEDDLSDVKFFEKSINSKLVDVLELSTNFTLPITLNNENLIVKLELFSKNSPNIVDETLISSISLQNLFEAYYSLDKIELEASKSLLSDSIERITLKPASNKHDDKKISSYNLYVKDLLASNNKFEFIETITDEYSFTRGTNDSYYLCYRVKPITNAGISNIFSDVIVTSNNLYKSNSHSSFFLFQENYQVNISIIINNDFLKSTNIIKLYRRNITNSINEDYVNIASFSLSSNILFTDDDLIIGNIYEYYYELLDFNQNVIGTSRTKVQEIHYNNKKTYTTKIENLSIQNNQISFNITTEKISQDTKNKFLISAGELVSTGPIEKSVNINDYQELFYYKVTRIDALTSEEYEFDTIDNSNFLDNESTRKISNIPELENGKKYHYKISTFKRDPITLTNNFIVSGNEAGGWFYKPSKWKNPQVFNSGILYSETEQNGLDLSNKDLFLSDFVETIILSNVNYYSNETKQEDVYKVNASKISEKYVKIEFELDDNLLYDSFILVKSVNFKKEILGITSSNIYYHRLTEGDIGTLYYEITPVMMDYSLGKTKISNSLTILDSLIDKF